MTVFNTTTLVTVQQSLSAGERGTVGFTGLLSPATGYGVLVVGNGASVTNAGTITSNAGGIYVDVNVTNFSLSNAGYITSTGGAVFCAGGAMTVVNSGEILGAGGNGDGVFCSGILNLTNSGSIISNDDNAIEMSSASGVSRVYNTGIIATSSASQDAIRGANGIEIIRNGGTILGNVSLDDGNDIFDTIEGVFSDVVSGGNGSDTYRISSSTVQIEEGAGNAGDVDSVQSAVDYALTANVETLVLLAAAREGVGNVLANTVTGNAFANRLLGQAGADTMSGLIGNDTVLGGTGDDRILGGDGSDNLQGEDGADGISGGDGADTLSGGGGADVLNGGSGADALSGGAGADRFDFNSTLESNSAGSDRIAAFARGSDRIDLDTIDARMNVAGNQDFTFIGTGAFSSTGQVRIVDLGANVRVEANTSNLAGAELVILVAGVGTLGAGDFLL